MSILKKPYKLSIWQIEWDLDGPKEKRIATIGSDTMISQNKAFNPKLVRNVNGTVTLTFSMYGKYIDNITGEQTINPFIHYLHNETILKLWYDDKWYDLIVKSVSEKSTNNIYEFSASDLHINELSKNGFNLEINQDLNNNYGSVTELGRLILEDTDWTVDEQNSHCSVQTIDEGLVRLVIPGGQQIEAIQILDPDPINPQGVSKKEGIQIPSSISNEPTIIYAFYSSCKNKPRRFQFIYVVNENDYQYDDNHIITNSNCQYYMECSQNEYANETIEGSVNSYRFIIPEALEFAQEEIVSSDKRGRRYVFGEKTTYNDLLQRNLTRYYDTDKEEECWCSTDVEYITPVAVTNLSGNTDFKSTNGWTASYIQTGELDEGWLGLWKKKPKDGLVKAMVMQDVVDSIISDKKFPENITPYLKFTPVTEKEKSDNADPVLVSSGPNDNKDVIKNLAPGEEYVIMYKPKEGQPKPEIEIAYYKESEDGLYDGIPGNQEVYLTFPGQDSTGQDKEWKWHSGTEDNTDFLPSFEVDEKGKTTNDFSVYSGYYYQIAKIPSDYILTENEYKARNVQMFIKGIEYGNSFAFEDLQFFKAEHCNFNFGSEESPKIVDTIITPKSGMIDTVIKIVYKFYTDDALNNAKIVDDIDSYFTDKDNFPEDRFKTVYYENAEKIRSIEAKESNYFNVLQSLCENFETWVDFNIDRNDDGSIISKKVVFKNYIGVQNYAGFKYGVNLQSITRKIDSANIVTKMIVKNNSNQAANNGYCSITRAASNETGENCIYNFSYYINQKIINEEQLINTLYNTAGATGADWDGNEKSTNCNGYYTRLKLLNAELDKEIELNNNYYFPLNQAQSNLTLADAGRKSAKEQMDDALANFAVVAGFDLLETEEISDEQAKLIDDSEDLQNYIYKYTEGEVQYKAYERKFKTAQAAIDKYSELYEDSNDRIDELTKWKKALHKAFQKLYGSYIQEGTWQEEKYYDDELYYIDALSTMRNSCFPQVQYTIQVAEISQIPGYEYYKFGLGDKTFIEDTEFFGYNSNGDPYREEIVLSEITEMLDDPSKNTITVKNYKTQFQDLFQRITASVQQTQFAQGSYAKAADLAEGSTKVKSSFLQEAMQDPALVLQNAGEQSVTWGPEGIVITDALEPSEQIRLIGGAILIKTKNENGLGTWKTAITSKGIAADLITAGRINTGEIQIMNGDQPTFRWDSLGLTAYDFNSTGTGEIDKINFSKGVRFDKFGIYGYESDNTNFIPTKHNISTAEQLLQNEKVTFGLTWEGLKVSNNGATIQIGCNNGKLIDASYNDNSMFYISNNGKAAFNGEIEALSGNIANWSIEDNGLFKSGAGLMSNDYCHTFEQDGKQHTYGSVRFYAGVYGNFGEEDHAMDANFIVTEKGYMKAAYGEIGPFNINSSGFWTGGFDYPTAGILYSDNISYMFSTIGNFSEINANDVYISNIHSHRFFGIGQEEDFTINDKRILTEDDLLSNGYELSSNEIKFHLNVMSGLVAYPNGNYGTVVLGPDYDDWGGATSLQFDSNGIMLTGVLYNVSSIQHYDNKEEKGFEYKLDNGSTYITLKCFQYPRQWFYFPEYYSNYGTDIASGDNSSSNHSHSISTHFRNWYVNISSD